MKLKAFVYGCIMRMIRVVVHKRQTQRRKINFLDQLLNTTSSQEIKGYLGSFRQKLDFTRYYIDNYEDGKKLYNTILQRHDIALIFRANAESTIFTLNSSLDCLANALNEIFRLGIPQVYFRCDLAKELRKKVSKKGNITEQKKISDMIACFLNENDYFFKLRNWITHNVAVPGAFALDLSSVKIKMSFVIPPNVKNVPRNREVDIYCNDIIDKIYNLSENIFKEILGIS